MLMKLFIGLIIQEKTTFPIYLRLHSTPQKEKIKEKDSVCLIFFRGVSCWLMKEILFFSKKTTIFCMKLKNTPFFFQ